MRTRTIPKRHSAKLVMGLRIAVITAEFNPEITGNLEKACIGALTQAGVPVARVERFSVPGCFEIPIMCQRLARKGRYDAIIALGAVIKGDTFHFELVASECARGVMAVSLKHDVPIIFEVLAVYNRRDALQRAGNNRMNKGIEAAGTALSVLAQLRGVK
jgi:6,7-dimethyl-8-ribityllumazine synthase